MSTGSPESSTADPAGGTAYETMRVAAETPDGRASATIRGVDDVSMWIETRYFESASVGELESQLARLAKLLFVERTRAYYRARSRDFSEPVLKESPPVTARDHEYVERRSELVVDAGSEESLLLSVVGLTHWSVRIDREWISRCDAETFCAAAAEAASELIRRQLAEARHLKLEIYA